MVLGVVALLDKSGDRVAMTLSLWGLLILGIVFFCTSALSLVTGSTSLITVPVLMQSGMEVQHAIATNMFALTLMSLSATLVFMEHRQLDYLRAPWLIGLTLIGSSLGALWLNHLPSDTLPTLIALSMLTVVGVSLGIGHRGVQPATRFPSRLAVVAGYTATFFLAIYGGIFSGGYATLLTMSFVSCFSHTFIEAIATSKLVNVFSSLIATLIFSRLGLVDYRLGLVLGLAMVLGASLGSQVVLKIGNLWLQRIYILVVVGLAAQLIITLMV